MTSMLKNESEQESQFGFDEIFISSTDKKGIIQTGNRVFIRVSEYSWDELYRNPHNVIRHPDMPKAIFKLLWAKLKANEPITAYVKNRSKSGKYYWVLATNYPSQGGYFSIRIKPSSSLLPVVQSLYTDALLVEKEKGMDAALLSILQKINSMGFATYEDFMVHALLLELKERKEKLFEKNKKSAVTKGGLSQLFEEMKGRASDASKRYSEAVDRISTYLDFKNKCEKDLLCIAEKCKSLEYLSVNMSISAHKLGKDGGVLAVVAENFEKTALQTMVLQKKFSTSFEVLLKKMTPIVVNMGCSKLQIEMLEQYLFECVDDMTTKKVARSEKEAYIRQTEELLCSFKEFVNICKTEQKDFLIDFGTLKKNSNLLCELVARLDLIRTGGRLEGSRSAEIIEKFYPFVIEMTDFVNSIQAPMESVRHQVELFSDLFHDVSLGTSQIEHTIGELELIQKTMTEINQKNAEVA